MNNRKGYKAFEKGLICNGKQYAENTTFEEEGGEICSQGMMHYCLNPLDCLDYYPLIDAKGNITEFAEVLAEEEPITDDNKKYATKKLHIGRKLDLSEFIDVSIDFLSDHAGKKKDGDYSQLAASGNESQLAVSGVGSKLASSGDESRLAASGNGSQLAASGGYSRLAASGNYSRLAASGNYSKLASSGGYSRLAASGNYSQLASSGDESRLAASGRDSIVAGIGIMNIAKASLGSWITLAEWIWDNKKQCYIPKCVKTEQVDGERIKADTWYKLENGEFVEVKR